MIGDAMTDTPLEDGPHKETIDAPPPRPSIMVDIDKARTITLDGELVKFEDLEASLAGLIEKRASDG